MAPRTPQLSMVSRETEIGILMSSLAGCREGNGSVVLVSGNAGIGKTRLIEEISRRAESEGFQVFVGRSVPGVPTPYFPFLDAFKNYSTKRPMTTKRFFNAVKEAAPDIAGATPIVGSLLRASASFMKEYGKTALDKDIFKERDESAPTLDRRTRLVQAAKASAPRIAEATPVLGPYLKASVSLYTEYQKTGLDPKVENERAMFSTLSFLKEISKDSPMLVCLEDLHWADSATIRMLHFLARNSAGMKAVFVGTYRPEEISVRRGEEIHPLQESLRVMRREKICVEVALSPLTRDEVGKATEAVLGAPLDGDLLQRVFHESGGNPLFAIELIKLATSTGLIANVGGVWRSKEGARFDIPPTIREIVLRRLEQLSREERRIIESAAVIGEWFDAGTLGEVLKVDRLHVLEELDIIAREHQLIQPVEGPFRFAHQKIQEVAYNEISPPRRMELHRKTGEAFEGRGDVAELYGELSYHFCEAKDDPRCVRYSLRAGKVSKDSYATGEAISYFQRVLDIVKDSPDYREEALLALEGLGDSYSNAGLVDNALACYEKWLVAGADPRDRARVLIKCSTLYLPTLKGDPEKSARLLDEAEKCEGIGNLEMGQIMSNRGALADTAGEVEKAEALYLGALRIFETEGNEREAAGVLDSISLLLLTRGDLQGALENAKREKEIFTRLNNFRGESAVSFRLATIYLTLGEIERSLEGFSHGIEIDTKLGDYRSLSFSRSWRGLAEYGFDDFEGASSDSSKGYDLSLKAESKYSSAASCALLALSKARLGRIEEAKGHLAVSNRLTDEIWKGFKGVVRTPTRPLNILANAEVLSAEGRWGEANDFYEKAIRVFHESWHNLFFEPLAYCRYGESLVKQERVREAREKFAAALKIYESIGNAPRTKRMEELLNMSS